MCSSDLGTDGVSLERIDFDRSTDDPTNWNSAAESAGFATPGKSNSQLFKGENSDELITIAPEIFSPDEDGFEDVLNISYNLPGPSFVGNITVFDVKGRMIKQLLINEYLSTEGVISWNGTNELNEKSPIGIYIIYSEFYNEDGEIIKSKKTCTLATQL